MSSHFKNLALVLNVQYYLCIFPYHFDFNDRTGTYTVQTTRRAHTVACSIVHSLILYEWLFATVLVCMNWEDKVRGGEISVHLVMAADTLIIPITLLVYIYVYWKSGPVFSQMFQRLANLDLEPASPSAKRGHKRSQSRFRANLPLLWTVVWIAAAILISEWMLQLQLKIMDTNGGSLLDIFYTYHVDACQLYWVPSPSSSSTTFGRLFHDAGAGLATFVHILVRLWYSLFTYGIMPLECLVGLFLNRLLDDFKKLCSHEDVGPTDFRAVIARYEDLKSIVRHTNTIFGLLYVVGMILVLIFFPGFSGTMFTYTSSSSQPITSVMLIANIVVFMGALFGVAWQGSSLHGKAMEFYEWIASEMNQSYCRDLCTEKGRTIPCLTMAALRMDMSTSQLSMKGRGFFVLNTNTATAVLGAVLTYTIIIWQFQASSLPKPSSS